MKCLITHHDRRGAATGEALDKLDCIFAILGGLRAVGVGMGLVHERATIDLDFHEYELADGRRFPLRARLTSIDCSRLINNWLSPL